MAVDREKAGFRGLVKRVETNAKSMIHWQVEPFRENEWLDEICVYDLNGSLLEWYSPENQILEQEAVRHRFVYDNDGNLLEKRGYSEEDSPEDQTIYVYADTGKLVESIYTSLIGHSNRHVYYDDRGNPRLIHSHDSKSGSLQFLHQSNYHYLEKKNGLETRVYTEEGTPGNLRRSSPEYTHVTIFNDMGNKVTYERYSNDWLEEVEVYNLDGQRIESTLFSKGSEIAWRHTYTYDDAKRLIESAFEQGSKIRNYSYEYDQFGNRTHMTDRENGLLLNEESSTYEYDSHHNWTTHIEFRNNVEKRSSTTEFERKITYF